LFLSYEPVLSVVIVGTLWIKIMFKRERYWSRYSEHRHISNGDCSAAKHNSGNYEVGARFKNKLRCGVLNRCGGRIFSAPVQTGPVSTQPPLRWVPGLFPRGVKWPERNADHPDIATGSSVVRSTLLFRLIAGLACVGQPLHFLVHHFYY
jgi:hypothetical protein